MPTTIHPTSRTLLAYLDGELPAGERRGIAAHLRGCAACRSDLDGIEADLDWYLVLDAASLPSHAPPAADGLPRLLAATRMWRLEHPHVNAAAAAENRRGEEKRLGDALAVYFGEGAAGAMASGPGATDRAETIFSAFLGRRAASTLMRDIRSRAEMDRFLAPDLT